MVRFYPVPMTKEGMESRRKVQEGIKTAAKTVGKAVVSTAKKAGNFLKKKTLPTDGGYMPIRRK